MDKLLELREETAKRRTFAIISHPDAGKTTLTEKLLLFGGAIRLAGTVKARKATRHATSDWMEIEKQRGISVTSSVMQFEFRGHKINILDTPGHQDFSEDTYRTLTAADCAVMLIDAAKGVEVQTIKLFQVCRLRKIPIFTFINKMDREARSPLELLEELEQVLGIRSHPMNWPIGSGKQFRGIFDRRRSRIERFREGGTDHVDLLNVSGVDDPQIEKIVGEHLFQQLQEDLELLDIAGDPFEMDLVREGQLTPVFFGSAINNFGLQTFLESFLELAPSPSSRMTEDGPVAPDDPEFSGYVFKIQANMNPAHRDRIAFLRVCSGKFERGMAVRHVRENKTIKLAQPQQFLAQDRDIMEEAYPGDIVGLFDTGSFRIGDSLSVGKDRNFEELPTFPPEMFRKVRAKNALKYKQYQKGISQLTDEGTIQVFRTTSGPDELMLGVIGQLQLEVFEYRMKAEYGVDIVMDHMSYQLARWVRGEGIEPGKFRINATLVLDKKDQMVALFESEYAFRAMQDKYPKWEFLTIAPK